MALCLVIEQARTGEDLRDSRFWSAGVLSQVTFRWCTRGLRGDYEAATQQQRSQLTARRRQLTAGPGRAAHRKQLDRGMPAYPGEMLASCSTVRPQVMKPTRDAPLRPDKDSPALGHIRFHATANSLAGSWGWSWPLAVAGSLFRPASIDSGFGRGLEWNSLSPPSKDPRSILLFRGCHQRERKTP